jgi:hypothetical protein
MSQRQHQYLFQLFPRVEELLALDLSDLAFTLLGCLITLRHEDLHLKNLNLRGEFTQRYPAGSKNSVELAVSSAWSWLMGQGFLGQQPEANDASWVTVTPHGRKWYEAELARRGEATHDDAAKVEGIKNAEKNGVELKRIVVEANATVLSLQSLGFESYSGIPLAEDVLLFLRGVIASPRKSQQQFAVTFISILAGFVYVENPLSNWFRDYTSSAGIDVSTILGMAQSTQRQPRTSDPTSIAGFSEEANMHPLPTWSPGARRLMEGGLGISWTNTSQGRTAS